MIYEVAYNQQQRWHLMVADEENRSLNAEEINKIAEVLNIIMMYDTKYAELKQMLCQE